MSNVAKAALEQHMAEDDEEPSTDGDADEISPFREALREAWDASKKGDADAFAEAFDAAIEIKLAER